jgi:haloalkane dehalogenase
MQLSSNTATRRLHISGATSCLTAKGWGRLIACDLIGMGDSDKLENSGPNRYTYAEHRDYLFALWDQLNLGDKIIMVLHDWGSALGFDWACRNPAG